MNYRHAFHAGNFADVVKHAVLVRILVHLATKAAPFRVIDTHAGAGIYDLAGAEATRTGEWRDGIGRLVAAHLPAEPRLLLAPYLDAVATFNPSGTLAAYPGSPALVRSLLRPQDRLVACELQPDTARALADNLHADGRAKVITIDGWTALKAYVPPIERRGLVLIDPAFEQPDEFARLADALLTAHRKWATGSYLLWYPIKDQRASDAFAHDLASSGIAKILRATFFVAAPDAERLSGCGLVIINPPWRLEEELLTILPTLAAILGRDRSASAKLDWLAREK